MNIPSLVDHSVSSRPPLSLRSSPYCARLLGFIVSSLVVLAATHSNCSRAAEAATPADTTLRLSTYLLFDGNCRAAMEFYRSIFGGELTLTTVGESPMKAMFPPALHARVVNARLQGAALDISASDWLRPTQTRVQGNAVCLYVRGKSAAEVTAAFRRLADGADVTDPLRSEPFGLYGALNDRYGVRWMFLSEKD